MKIENLFFNSVLNLMPNDSNCYIQAPDLPSIIFSRYLRETEYSYYKLIKLDKENRVLLLDAIENQNLTLYIQSIEIKLREKLLFEGFDGLEYGTISKEIPLTQDFTENFIEQDMCSVSMDW